MFFLKSNTFAATSFDGVTQTTRNHFLMESRDQDNDVTNQLHLSRAISSVSLNFITCQKVEEMEAPDFFHEKLGQ